MSFCREFGSWYRRKRLFENVLGQYAASQLAEDIRAGLLAPAMLFSGPHFSGKGTAALELGRVISCEGDASWNCSCPACKRQRFLIHPDLLCLGAKPFSAEIAASAGAFLREAAASRDLGNLSSRILFIRSVRKLLARFSPAVWEDDPKLGKISPLVNSLEEDLDELNPPEGNLRPAEEASSAADALSKLVEGILKKTIKLEAEGISETIPIAQIRKAIVWGRLAPSGRWKLLVIENADRTQEEARNSLLKLLEEPPGRLRIVLTSSRPGTLLPTMLSRLRPYRFGSRSAETEAEVIRRVFKDTVREKGIGEYLDSFLPVRGDTLSALAAFFAASVAYKAALLLKRQGSPIPEEVVLLGKSSAPRAEAAGFGRPGSASASVVKLVLEKAGGFAVRSLFSRFLAFLLEQASLGLRLAPASFLPSMAYNEVWKKNTAWAESAVAVYNLDPALALEKLFLDLSRGMAGLCGNS